LVNFTQLGCSEQKTYNPYEPSQSIVSTDTFPVGDIVSSEKSHDNPSFKVKNLEQPPAISQKEIISSAKDSLSALQEEIFNPDTPKIIEKKIISPALKKAKSESIASSQKQSASKKIAANYNCPCLLKKQVTAGTTWWMVAKYNNMTVAQLQAINKPELVKNLKVGSVMCLKRKKC
jgi:hypothetical protein